MERPSLKSQLGCWLHERWRTEVAICAPRLASQFRMDWKWLCNRHERLTAGEDGATICDWENSSILTAARLFPDTGGRLLKRCLQEWPVRLADATASEAVASTPKISIILPVGGRDRIPLFLCVLKAFFGQTVKDIEILAVEHSATPDFRDVCPPSVNYLFLPRSEGQQFNKSLAMNAAVSAAQAPAVLLHDADVVPPARYLESILEILGNGWDAVRPIRFTFELDRCASEAFMNGDGRMIPAKVAEIRANNPGLSTALTKDVYAALGGHDERFEGWGGEDAEFLDRLKTVRLFPGEYCPAIHLWHHPASKKATGDRNTDIYSLVSAATTAERIYNLTKCSPK
jgi:N-terminal domain of galactosyltransferase/Glycosyl transferase family 2